MPPAVATIPPGAPFLDTLAARWLDAAAPDPSRGLILLPTRRAARTLADAFLHVSEGRPMLLPRIVALGALDETPLALAGALDLPPAVDAPERLAVLARLIMQLPEEHGGVRAADRAWALAQELAALMDEAERAELDLPDALGRANQGAYAEHWQVTLRFLAIVTRAWPAWLAERGLMNPAARQVRLLRALARDWEGAPPAMPVWVAGSSGGIPSVAALLRVVGRLPGGQVVLPGLDTDMPEATWDALDCAHPQATLAGLLAGMGVRRDEVRVWDAPSATPSATPAGRAALLARALLPASRLGEWRGAGVGDITGLSLLSPADQQEEAVAVALVLRDALQAPGRIAALVTPDRALAVRVSAELLRWGVVADDSAGEKLCDTPPAVFLRLLARAVADDLAPVPLLALLKHPFAAAGLAPAACRAAARKLERAALRGARPAPGWNALRAHVARRTEPRDGQDALGADAVVARDLLDRIEHALAPLLRVFATAVEASPTDLLAAAIESAEALATGPDLAGPERLWTHEEGEAVAAQLMAARGALHHLPDQPPRVLPGLLDALLEGPAVRSRRALRGRDGGGAEHPRVFIWGLLEARLQSADVIVLGGLAEGVWPPLTEPGPWMSRQMRAAAGMPDPDVAVGQSAHDFVMAACCAPVVVLSCPSRRDRAPAVPARWLARLEALLAEQGSLPVHPAVAWARLLDLPEDGLLTRVPPPAPRPPVALRPRRLSLTDVATLVVDPYSIYAKHILRLRPLDPLDQDTDTLDIGNLVHHGLQLFLVRNRACWPADAPRLLREAMGKALVNSGVRPSLRHWWAPRLDRIAAWIGEVEPERRARAKLLDVQAEVPAVWRLDIPGGFELHGRADRIELRADGSLCILDYKTGEPPTNPEVLDGAASQLLLEGAMARAGAFGPDLQSDRIELAYWHLTGGHMPGEVQPVFKGDAVRTGEEITLATGRLLALLRSFDDPHRSYPHHPHPGRRQSFAKYDQLARVAEWGEEAEA